jgi:hypothetical protein
MSSDPVTSEAGARSYRAKTWRRLPAKTRLHRIDVQAMGSVAGPVIQATGRSEFEDGLGSGDYWPVHLLGRQLPSARRQGVFGYPKQSAIVSLASVLK